MQSREPEQKTMRKKRGENQLLEPVRSYSDCTQYVNQVQDLHGHNIVMDNSLLPPPMQLDEERQSLAEQLAEAQEKLREREKEEGEEIARLKALLADLERRERERTGSVEEVYSYCSLI